MKFLVDNAISPVVTESLRKQSLDALHVRDFGMQNASDTQIFRLAFNEERIIITADTDFGFLLSRWHKNKPSVIIFRKGTGGNPLHQIQLLKLNLSQLSESLKKGSIVIIEPHRIRIKNLPFFK